MITLIVTTRKNAISLYAKKLAERLNVNKFYSNVLQEYVRSNTSWFSKRAFQALQNEIRFIRTLKKIKGVLHFPCQMLGRYGNFLKVPYIITVHDLIQHFAIERPGLYCLPFSNRDKFYLNLDRFGIKKAKKIIAISHYTKKDLLNFFKIPEEQIRVVHQGVDHEIFKPVSRKIVGYPYILFTGSEQPRKNFSILLKAFSFLKKDKQFKELKLVKIGTAEKKEYRMATLKVIKELDLAQEIIFTEFISVEDLVVYYSGAQCFVFPSLYEGFGLPVLEAMACGCPVIISNLTSLPEVAEGAAIEINPNNTEELANAIKEVLANQELRQTLISKGLERAKEFSWEKTAKETLAVYEEVGRELEK